MIHLLGKAAKTALISAVAALLLASSSLAGEVVSNVGAVSGAGVRMRADASTSSEIVSVLSKDTAVAVLGEKNGWYRVSLNGKTGYIRSDYLTLDADGVFSAPGAVSADSVNVRASASASSAVVGSVSSGDPVTVNGFSNGWYSVTCKSGTKGYIRSDLMNLTDGSAASSDPTAVSSGKGATVVATAKQYLGVRYSYGGASPSGFDCSGFTMYVYGKHGVSLPHSATSQWQSGKGTKVYSSSALQAGDLVFFCDPSRSNGKACSHAGIYIGGGQFIHASSSASKGVIISALSNSYYATYFVGGLHIL